MQDHTPSCVAVSAIAAAIAIAIAILSLRHSLPTGQGRAFLPFDGYEG